MELVQQLLHTLFIRIRANHIRTLFVLFLGESASVLLDDALDYAEGLDELVFALAAIMGDDFTLVVRRCDHLELELPCFVVDFVLGGKECLADGFNTVVTGACEQEVDADFERVRGQLTVQSGKKFLFVIVADLQLLEDLLRLSVKGIIHG